MRLHREPLVHFLAIGASIFILHALIGGRDPQGERGRIVVTRGQIDALAANFQRTWQRPPSREELDGLIRDLALEEASAREAIALGLDRDDSVIRRRLQQKLEFVSEDLAASAEPTEADLAAYLSSHPEAFRSDDRITFRHVYLSAERHGPKLRSDADAILARLAGGADPEGLGDPFLLDRDFEDVPVGEIATRFGERFAREMAELPAGAWRGPVESSYGLHLVLVASREEGRLPPLDAIREEVLRGWQDASRAEARAKFRDEILKRYRVEIEAPPGAQAAEQ
jgi:hypothetical protein